MPLFGSLNDQMASNKIYETLYVDTFHSAILSISTALFILVTGWQLLKSMFGFAGVETEEPQKIAVKAFFMAFAMYWSKDILMFGVEITTSISVGIMNQLGVSSSDISGIADKLSQMSAFDVVEDIGNTVNLGTLTGLISFVLLIYLVFKILGIYIRMIERVVLSAFLIICAPLAFATGAAAPTKGFLTGFIKVYVGNLVIQILQYVGMSILLLTFPSMDIFNIFVMLAIAKVIAKLEDIVRDMSVGVGIGRDMGGGVLQKVQSITYAGGSITGAIRHFKG